MPDLPDCPFEVRVAEPCALTYDPVKKEVAFHGTAQEFAEWTFLAAKFWDFVIRLDIPYPVTVVTSDARCIVTAYDADGQELH